MTTFYNFCLCHSRHHSQHPFSDVSPEEYFSDVHKRPINTFNYQFSCLEIYLCSFLPSQEIFNRTKIDLHPIEVEEQREMRS